jgi:hypothetical protein
MDKLLRRQDALLTIGGPPRNPRGRRRVIGDMSPAVQAPGNAMRSGTSSGGPREEGVR